MAGKSIVIVGAGMFGLTAALELRQRGWQVSVLDQGAVPNPDAASNDISKVVRMDYGDDELYAEMGEHAIAGWLKWNVEWKQELFHQDGFLLMTRDETMPVDGFEALSYRTLLHRGQPLRRIDRAALAREFPLWNATAYGDGYFNARAGWVESGAVVTKLAELAVARGVTLQANAPFAGFSESGSTVRGVRAASGEEFGADRVLLAAGAWTNFLLPEMSDQLRATGHCVFHFRPNEPQKFRAPHFPVWAADIARTGWYGFPANSEGIVKIGHHGIGPPILSAAQTRNVEAEMVAHCRAFLRDTFPALADAPMVATRQCWYSDSSNGDFLIDHHPRRPGLVVTGGDSGHGFKFAPVLGRLIADVVERRENPWAARFRWKDHALPGREQSRAEV